MPALVAAQDRRETISVVMEGCMARLGYMYVPASQ
jgi:hypothetical protein